MKKLLFTRNSEIIQPLRRLISEQKHHVLILWALECSEFFLNMFEKKIPNDNRPRIAIKKARTWAEGNIKMPEAKAAILDCHNAARDASNYPNIEAAARAIGHACATVHVETHAIGLVIYGLTSLVYNNEEHIIEQYLDYFYDRLLYHQDNSSINDMKWATFITKDKPNKEKLLLEKEFINGQL